MWPLMFVFLLITPPFALTYGSRGGTGGHKYPVSTGLSGNHHSSGDYHTNPASANVQNYNPPRQIVYGSTTYPVYHGTPPVYVYSYRNSGSRFDTLLTGLALYNLGRMSSHQHHIDYHETPGEICKLGIEKPNGDFEEVRVQCDLMSSFIWEDPVHSNTSQYNVTSTVTETEISESIGNNTGTTAATVKNAIEVKGSSIQVTEGMKCYMMREVQGYSVLKKQIDCEVLQTYALSVSDAHCNIPLLKGIILALVIQYF